MKKAFLLLTCTALYLSTLAQSQQFQPTSTNCAYPEPGLPVIKIENAMITEGDQGGCYMVLFLSLDKRSKDPVKVQYHTSGNTGRGEEDYLQKKGTVTFPANRILQTVKIPLDCEVHNQMGKTIFVKLSGAVNATPEHITATGRIHDVHPVSAVSLNKSQF